MWSKSWQALLQVLPLTMVRRLGVYRVWTRALLVVKFEVKVRFWLLLGVLNEVRYLLSVRCAGPLSCEHLHLLCRLFMLLRVQAEIRQMGGMIVFAVGLGLRLVRTVCALNFGMSTCL